MKNVRLMDFRYIQDPDDAEFYGGLVPLEGARDIPFEIKRIYTISGMQPGARRGYHSHRDLEQVLIALGGSIKILVKTPFEEEVITLDSPAKGLYIGPMIWREMFDFSPNSTLMVLASKYYNEGDYLREYEPYEREAREYFSK